MLAGIVLLLVTGSVFFFALVIFSVLSKAYEQYQERYVAKSMSDLSDMALFIDAGQVAADRRDFDFAEFDVAWGIGARFHGPTYNAFRIEVARGREGIRLVFAGSQPF